MHSSHRLTVCQKECRKSLKKLKDPKDFYQWSREANQNLNNQFSSKFRERLRTDGVHLEGNIQRKISSKVSASAGATILGDDGTFFA
jgi:hypothetical protein